MVSNLVHSYQKHYSCAKKMRGRERERKENMQKKFLRFEEMLNLNSDEPQQRDLYLNSNFDLHQER
jgi:hypothetical protein